MSAVFENGVFEEDVFEGEGGGGSTMPSLSEISALYVGADPVLRAYFGSTLIWGEPPETDFTLTETGDGAILANLPPLIPFDAVDETGDGAILTMEP